MTLTVSEPCVAVYKWWLVSGRPRGGDRRKREGGKGGIYRERLRGGEGLDKERGLGRNSVDVCSCQATGEHM